MAYTLRKGFQPLDEGLVTAFWASVWDATSRITICAGAAALTLQRHQESKPTAKMTFARIARISQTPAVRPLIWVFEHVQHVQLFRQQVLSYSPNGVMPGTEKPEESRSACCLLWDNVDMQLKPKTVFPKKNRT